MTTGHSDSHSHGAPSISPLDASARALSDARLTLLSALVLFVLGAWPLLLVGLPPFQDLPNHVATAHIVAHPDLYPQLGFNGYFKSNAMLTLWFRLTGGLGLFGAARVFTAVVLAANALALPHFVLHFRGRQAWLVALCFAWPLVHSFSVAMGFLNFALAFALSLVLLTRLDRQRIAVAAGSPGVGRGLGIAVLAGVVWYAHPFPLAVVGVLVALHVLTRPDWAGRWRTGLALLLPLGPAAVLALVSAQQHLVKVEGAPTAATVATIATTTARFAYLNPWEILLHLWTDVSGAFTPLGAMTVVPAVLLPVFAWRNRGALHPLLSAPALALLAAAYLGLPEMLSNWHYLQCRLVPFLWAGLLLRLPDTLPRPLVPLLIGCALLFSAATGVDYLRLDRDRAAFTAGIEAVPARATLMPLLFRQAKTSTFTASLTHAWGYYTVARDTSAPLVFAAERSYPITYRQFPPPALIAPALDQFARRNATPALVCKALRQVPMGDACTAAHRDIWTAFWTEAEPRFTHLLTWAMPAEARALIPARYRRVYAARELEIYARDQR